VNPALHREKIGSKQKEVMMLEMIASRLLGLAFRYGIRAGAE
jgi:hypothetical protein